MQFSSILTVLDKPKHSQSALAKALQLQRRSQGALELVSFYWSAMLDSNTTFDAKQRRKMRHEMHEKLEAWQQQLLHEEAGEEHLRQYKVKRRCVWGHDIAGWVAEAVAKGGYDLVIKSLHRSKTLLYTPTDWQILRTCGAPVLFTTAKSRAARKRKGPVLVALDFKSSDAKHRRLNARLMAAGADYAELTGAPLHVIFAIEISQVLRDLDLTNEKVTKAKVLRDIEPLVERTLAGYRVPKSNIHFPVGKAGRVINSRAHKLKAGVIVVGAAAHPITQSLGLGNTAERILTKAYHDVLVINP